MMRTGKPLMADLSPMDHTAVALGDYGRVESGLTPGSLSPISCVTSVSSSSAIARTARGPATIE